MSRPKICGICGFLKPQSEFGIINKKKGYRHSYCSSCLKIYNRNKHRVLKNKCVQFLGGRCSQCGYDKCLAAFEFHHRDKTKKHFEIGTVRTVNFSAIKKELKKCKLLCSNCHAELHEKERISQLGHLSSQMVESGWPILKARKRHGSH